MSVMKKSVYRALVLIMLSMSWIASLAQGGLRPRGDVNCDWQTGIDDATALINMVLNGTEYHSLYTYAADINGDKTLKIEDVSSLLSGLLKGVLSAMPSYSCTLPGVLINA